MWTASSSEDPEDENSAVLVDVRTFGLALRYRGGGGCDFGRPKGPESGSSHFGSIGELRTLDDRLRPGLISVLSPCVDAYLDCCRSNSPGLVWLVGSDDLV
jgi:hypothetical protein